MGCNYQKICSILDEYGIKRTNKCRRKYSLNENYFDDINTPNKAYILGLMYADGCNFPPKSTSNISLQESDKELLEKIKIEIESTQPLKFIDQSNRNDNGYSYKMCIRDRNNSYNQYSKRQKNSVRNGKYYY